MRRMLSSYLAGLAFLFASSAGAADATSKTTLTIKGMTCGGCVAAVKLQLRKTAGVIAYVVSLENGEAEVTYDAAKTEPKKIAESVSTTGFEATVKSEEKKSASPTSDGAIRHQLRQSAGADQTVCLDPGRSSREVLARLERKG